MTNMPIAPITTRSPMTANTYTMMRSTGDCISFLRRRFELKFDPIEPTKFSASVQSIWLFAVSLEIPAKPIRIDERQKNSGYPVALGNAMDDGNANMATAAWNQNNFTLVPKTSSRSRVQYIPP